VRATVESLEIENLLERVLVCTSSRESSH
jgi:hypothetical protein